MAKRMAVVAMGMLAMLLGGKTVSAQTPTEVGSRIRVADVWASSVVARAVKGAAATLESPDCQRLLTDFNDEAGNPLTERLKAIGRTASQFVTELWYVDASAESTCILNQILAYTKPGMRIIYICAKRVAASTGMQSGRRAEAIIIHEMLHALGLGEGGRHPSAEAITQKVLTRCER